MNEKKYLNVFMDIFKISKEDAKTAHYKELQQWDSVGHMSFIMELENTFQISLEFEDILHLNSYENGKEILKKYGVEF